MSFIGHLTSHLSSPSLEKLPRPASKWTNTHFGFSHLCTLCDIASWLAYTLLYSSSKRNDRRLITGQNVTSNDVTMKWTLAAVALLGSAYADAIIAPRDGSCDSSYNGKFQVTIAKVNKRDIQKRDCDNADALLLTLDGGILKDAKGRTGYIASNYQFQFDSPPQAGAIVSSGFAACQDGSLALGGKTTWFQCQSGNFFNLYDRNWAPQCQAVEILIMPCSGGGSSGGSGGSSGSGGNNDGSGGSGGSGGEVTVGTKVVQTTVVTVISDGQPQVHTTTIAIPICQINDGQIQAPPVTQIHDGQPQAPPVTQIHDGQPQAPPVTQIGDGQPQAPPVTHAQPQPPPVTQIGDGQPQAPTPPPAHTPPSQPESPPAKPESPPVTQIGDGQPQAPVATGTAPTPPPPATTTRAPISGGSRVVPGISVALAVALVGMVAL
ncbi:hypothetical protein TrVGV298_011200 [Trichoderma virens]|nr:hypothetical protein TrVGV298_011200 [Trichoderma virens]